MGEACNPFHQTKPEFRVLYIFGAGGHGREVAWLAEQCWGKLVEIVHVVDHQRYLIDSVNGNSVQLLDEIKFQNDARFIVALGDSAARKTAVEACVGKGLTPTTIVFPRVEASGLIELGAGTIICAGSILTTNIRIGQHVHINIGSTISHDACIGDFSTISPGVHISGHVQIGNGVFIGTGANIINGSSDQPLVIGDGTVVAAGACVTKSVEAGALVAGVPATRKR